MTKAAFSLADLNAVTASDTPVKVEMNRPDGTGSGVFLLVLGNQSSKVQTETNRLINERRKQEANLAALTGGDFIPVESDIEFGHRLTNVRLAGWSGIEEEWTPENGLILIRTNEDAAKLVNSTAKRTGDFLPLKPKG